MQVQASNAYISQVMKTFSFGTRPLLVSVLLSLYACFSGSDRENIFRYNETSGIASLDPAFAKNQSTMWAANQFYNTLVSVDSQLHIVPSLASRWEVSADKRTYTFYLRPGVRFHDDPCFTGGKGRYLRAADVVYSFSRIMDAATASPGAWIFNNRVDSIHPFEAVNDSVFVLRLQQPFHPILGILSMQYCSVVPREAVDYYGNQFRRHPVGTGPFRFAAWEEGLALLMRKNPHYFEKDAAGNALPYLDGVQVSFADSKATEFLLFRQGKLDFINDIDASFKDEVLTKKGLLRKEWEGKIRLHTSPYLNIEYFGILVDAGNEMAQSSPLREKEIRRALNYAIDREKMILYLRNSLGIPAQAGFIPAGLPAFDSTVVRGYRYDPKKARELVEQSRYKKTGAPVIKLYTVPIYSDIASYVARQAGEVGINVQVEVVQKSLLLEMTSGSKAAFFRGSWIADYPDAENYLSVFYSKNPAPPNYTRYRNPAFDALLEQAMAETDDERRLQLYRQADQLMIQDAPVVPLWYDVVVHLVQPWVQNFKPNALNLLELKRVRKEKH